MEGEEQDEITVEKGDVKEVLSIPDQGGRTSTEYATIQGRFQRIVTSLEQDGVLDKVMTEMFEKKLITREHYTKCKSQDSTSSFMIEILRRIELDKDDFLVFIRSLSRIPALENLYDELLSSVDSSSQVLFESPSHSSVKASEEVDSMSSAATLLDPETQVPSNTSMHIVRTSELPSSSAYNGSTGLMPQLTSNTAYSPSTNSGTGSIDVLVTGNVIDHTYTYHGSEGVFTTPAPDTQLSTREGEQMIVNGCNHQSNIVRVQEEIHDYKSRLGKVEVVLQQLKKKVDNKVDNVSHQKLSVELYRQQRSCEFHQDKINSYQDSLIQLKVLKAEIKAEVKAEIDEIVESSLQEKNSQLEEMGVELETCRKEVETLKRSSIQMSEIQQEMNKKLEELKVQVVQSKEEVSEVKAKTDALKTEIDAVSATQTPTHTPAAPTSERPCQCRCACNIL